MNEKMIKITWVFVMLTILNILSAEINSKTLLKKGWKQFKKENYKEAKEYFSILVEREELLADAYTGVGWCDLMLFEPEFDTLTYNLNEHNFQQYYPVHPNEIYELYSREDDCPPGWFDNAIKTMEDGKLMFKNTFHPSQFTPEARHFFLIGIDDIEKLRREAQKRNGKLIFNRKGVEYGVEDTVYDYFMLDNSDANLYNEKTGILTIDKDIFLIKDKDVLAQLSPYW
jgi:hypothetical protein